MSQPVSLPSDLVVSLAKQLKGMDTNPAYLQMIDTFLNAVPKDLSRPRTNIDDFRQLLDELSPSGLTRHQLLELGSVIQINHLGSFGLALCSSPTWEIWCQTLSKYAFLTGLNNKQLQFKRDGDTILIILSSRSNGIQPIDLFSVGILQKLLLVSKQATSSATCEHMTPLSTYLENQNSGEHGEQALLFIRFNILENADKPRLANSKVNQVFRKDLLNLGLEDEKQSIALVVEQLIESQSDLNHVNQTWVASQLHTSERNLLRKIKVADTSFRKLFNRVRSKRSLELLLTGMSISKIGRLLGYSERATFERAFKTWQGVTPVAMQSRFACLTTEKRLASVITAESVPTPPVLLVKLVKLISNDDFHMDELVELVESDPVLTSKVLSIANSVIYGYSGITSVKQAILKVLGVQKLQALVITILSAETLPVEEHDFSYNAFWQHSIVAAQVSTVICEASGVKKSEQFPIYIAAMLHNIGHLGLAHCLAEGYRELEHEGLSSLDWTQQLHLQKLRLGIHSIQVTEILLNLWNFPEEVIGILRNSNACQDFFEPNKNNVTTPLAHTLHVLSLIKLAQSQGEDVVCALSPFFTSVKDQFADNQLVRMEQGVASVVQGMSSQPKTSV